MKFTPTKLAGAYVVDIERREDERGFFARSFCQMEFQQHSLTREVAQCNISFSVKKGTLRGMHYQVEPFAEAKLVRCTSGAIYDVIIDLRQRSETFCQWIAVELTAENHRMLYVPQGFAHGYLTLQPDTEVFYLVSSYYSSEHERGVRWNDPRFGVEWPFKPASISQKDAGHPDFHL